MTNFDAFQRQSYLNLLTFRKNGVEMPTPVWFVEVDGAFLIQTGLNAGKIKRIRNNARVRIAPCDSRGRLKGAWIDATASIVSQTHGAQAQTLALKKYGLIKRIFDIMQRRKYDVIRVEPVG